MIRRALIAVGLVLFAFPALAGAATVSGTVKSQSAGQPAEPLAGATVSVIDPVSSETVGTDVTGELGDYSIVAPSGSFDVLVEPPEGPYGPTTAHGVDLSSPRTLNFTLAAGGTHDITGTLSYPGGAPLEGSKVFLQTPGGKEVDTYAFSKENGYYELTAPPGEYKIRYGGSALVGGPQFNVSTDYFELSEDTEIDLQLPSVTQLTVRVLDGSEEPIDDAGVKVPGLGVHADLGDLEANVWGTIKPDTTDAEGEAVFPAFDGAAPAAGIPGLGTVTPTPASGYAEADFELPTVEGPTTVTVYPEPTSYFQVDGTLRYDGGAPIQGAKVLLETLTGTIVATSGYTPAGGTFGPLTAPTGTYRLSTSRSADAGKGVPQWTLVTDPFELSEDIEGTDIELPPTTVLTVEALDTEEGPLQNATVQIPGLRVQADVGDFEARVTGQATSAKTSAAGKAAFAAFDGAAPLWEALGSVTPTKASEYGKESFEVPVLAGPTTVVVHPPPTSYFEVSGSLHWPGGEPIPWARVILEAPGGKEVDVSTYTPESGAFAGLTADAGTYRLRTSRAGNATLGVPEWAIYSEWFELSEDREGVELELPPVTELTVRVLDASEEPLAANVHLPQLGVDADLGALEGRVVGRWDDRHTDGAGEAVFPVFDGAGTEELGSVFPSVGGYAEAEFEVPLVAGPSLAVVSYAPPPPAPKAAPPGDGESAVSDRAAGPGAGQRGDPASRGADATLRAGKRDKVAVRFRAPGSRGLGVLRAGFPRSRAVDCATVAPRGPWRRAAQAAPLQRSRAGVYTFHWDVSGVRGCAVLRLGLEGGGQRDVLLER